MEFSDELIERIKEKDAEGYSRNEISRELVKEGLSEERAITTIAYALGPVELVELPPDPNGPMERFLRSRVFKYTGLVFFWTLGTMFVAFMMLSIAQPRGRGFVSMYRGPAFSRLRDTVQGSPSPQISDNFMVVLLCISFAVILYFGIFILMANSHDSQIVDIPSLFQGMIK